jgi:ribonuclease HI
VSRIVIATDGACLPTNPGPGGWAWITEDGQYDSGHKPHATNNEMELTAIWRALLAFPHPTELHIQSDSQYSINCVTKWWMGWERNGWKRRKDQPIKNVELIKSIVTELWVTKRAVTFEWVRGHNGHPLNEAADSLAEAAVHSLRS